MHPFVLRNFLSENNWPPLRLWTDEYLAENLGKGKGLTVRIGEKKHFRGKVLYEHQCDRHTFENSAAMLQWMTNICDNTNELFSSSTCPPPNPTTHWAYLDYRDVLELFEQEKAECIDWSLLGMNHSAEDGTNWRDSTIWIGTPGAYTPCHFDTYGFNLHAQLRGHKRWLMFPPDDDILCQNKNQMWPTRLPYEESSVFSELDIIGDDPRINRKMSVWSVTIGPGDLLFVPPKWWHSVQCVIDNSFENISVPNPVETQSKNVNSVNCGSSMCISVNKWFPAPGDCRESAKEALLKFMMELFTSSGLLNLEEHICPMERNSMESDLKALTELVEERLKSTELVELDGPSAPKRIKFSSFNSKKAEDNPLQTFYTKFSSHPKIERIEPIEWEQWRKKCKSDDFSLVANSEKEEYFMKNKGLKMELLDALSSSEVLDTLLNVLMSRRIEKEPEIYNQRQE